MTALGATVIILSGQSLFAEGLAARLSQQLGEKHLMTVDARSPGALQNVIDAEPAAVILDASDAEVTQLCPLSALLSALPSLKIFRLDPQHDQVQIVTSERRQAGQVQDIVELIRAGKD